jgi:aspartate aminotransferase
MTGFRIGWAVANTKIIKAMDNVQAQNLSCVSVVCQEAAIAALNGNQNSVIELQKALEKNRNLIVQELKKIPGVKITPPDGTFYCFPDFRAFNGNSVELCKSLLEKALVVTVPGKEFGLEGYLRLSYCGSEKDIIDGVARIRWAIDPSSPKEINIGDKKYIRDWK